MAFIREMIDISLGGRSFELCRGHVVVLYRGVQAMTHVRVESLEDANRLEAVAQGVEGVWQPHYRYDGKPLSVNEFEAALAKGDFNKPKVKTKATAAASR